MMLLVEQGCLIIKLDKTLNNRVFLSFFRTRRTQWKSQLLKINKNKFLDYFISLEDPRIDRCKLHPLNEIVLLTIGGIMCGCESWEDIEEFGLAKHLLLTELLPYKSGIPSDDTLRRFFRAIDYTQFETCFISWVKSLNVDLSAGVVAIDGKTACGSKDGAAKAMHMVSAFASEQNIILGQEKVSGKSNEITAIPALLELLDINDALVTIDALGCQTKIADKIIEKDADYLLAVKKNQEGLYLKIENFFESGLAEKAGALDKITLKEKNRDRLEKRICYISSASFLDEVFQSWKNLKSILCLQSARKIKNKLQTEKRYYICSRQMTAKDALYAIRSH